MFLNRVRQPGRLSFIRAVLRLTGGLGVGAVLLLLTGCGLIPQTQNAPGGSGTPSMLDARGPTAAHVETLWWVTFAIGTGVFLIVTGILLYAALTRSRPGQDLPEDQRVRSGNQWILWGGLLIPTAILIGILVYDMGVHRAMAFPGDDASITIDVIGHRWWWEVHYPDEGIVTANEIHIPIGQPVHINLISNDVIHSFWVPQLTGKIDLTPGRVNTAWMQADQPGVYRGICAEFCGLQHALMAFVVVAEPAEDYAAWVARESQPARQPETEELLRGQQVFLGSSCVYCHTVRGTNASGVIGPDLTHIASRSTLAAGTLENNRGNLAGWIVDPQTIKPGNLMPPTHFSSEDFQLMLTYLQSLD